MNDSIKDTLLFLIEHRGSCFIPWTWPQKSIDCKDCIESIQQVCYFYWFVEWEVTFYRARSLKSGEPLEHKGTFKQAVYKEAVILFIEKYGKEELVEMLL